VAVRRTVLPWVVAVVLLLVVTTSGVLVARTAVFSATAFARVYLDALARGDTAGALAMPGVSVPASARTDLLGVSGIGGAADAHVVRERDGSGSIRLVDVEWRRTGVTHRTTFRLAQEPAVAGVLPQWRFAQNPVATVRFAISGGTAVRVAGHRVDTAAVQRGTPAGAPFALLVPGAWSLDLRDPMVTADAGDLVLAGPGDEAATDVTLEPTARFTTAVRTAVGDLLDACAAQTVLYPPGCPFGEAVTDRLASTPTWTVPARPTVRLQPVEGKDAWITSPSPGTAHLSVQVRSIFDGVVSDLDQDVPFTASWDVRLDGTTAALGALRDAAG
jgi:hypothetical protein